KSSLQVDSPQRTQRAQRADGDLSWCSAIRTPVSDACCFVFIRGVHSVTFSGCYVPTLKHGGSGGSALDSPEDRRQNTLRSLTALSDSMKLRFVLAAAILAATLPLLARTEKPLRVFIRASEKTHGPGQHDYPRFLRDWTQLLNERGAVATGALRFPTQQE